jgi:CheY-like chemotaxis protein
MAGHRPRRVLVVEDNEVNQALTVAILTKLGYRSEVVGDGRQAVEVVPRGGYGAVLMDCQLPVLDGYQATAGIRRREGTARRTPIIAMTAAVLQDGRECLAAGMDDQIAKPVLLAEVEAVLARWLQDGGRHPDGRRTGRPATPASGVLDQRRLAELGGLDPAGNGPALVGRLLECFLARIPVELADLRTAFHHGDAARALRVAHRLKGAAATVGSGGMVSLCEQLELRARAGTVRPAGDLLPLLEQEFGRVIRALDAIVPGRRPRDPEGTRPGGGGNSSARRCAGLWAGQLQPALDQVLPDQPSPDHMRPVQVPADHMRPDHIRPDQTSLDHMRPDHIRPDQVMAAMIWLTSAAPMASATFTLTMRASGAMPRKLVVSPA